MNWDDVFYYDETSPSCLRWKIDRYASGLLLVSKGDPAGTIGGQKYYRVQLCNVIYTVHLIIWEIFYGEVGVGFQADHIDLCKTNNKISNLRVVSRSLNCRNRPKRSDNTSGITGLKYRQRTLPSGNTHGYWCADFVDRTGKRCSKEFAETKYGAQKSKEMALKFLDGRASEDNGYTEQHGK